MTTQSTPPTTIKAQTPKHRTIDHDEFERDPKAAVVSTDSITITKDGVPYVHFATKLEPLYCEPDDNVPPELGGGTVQEMAADRDAARREVERWREVARVLSTVCGDDKNHWPPSRREWIEQALSQATRGKLDEAAGGDGNG
jgi:hypothetical protein